MLSRLSVRQLCQTNGKFGALTGNVLLQDLSRWVADRRDQSAERMQILIPIDNATRCPTKGRRLVIVKVRRSYELGHWECSQDCRSS
jgi:hypothetical protein